jgi:hypothetical protein
MAGVILACDLHNVAGVDDADRHNEVLRRRREASDRAERPGHQATLAVPAGSQRIGWVSATGPNFGIATVYLDGVAIRAVDLYTSTLQRRKIVVAFAVAPGTTHTVSVKITSKDPGSTGYLDAVDAFLVIH